MENKQTRKMPTCVVPNCREVGVHTFPKDIRIKRLWEKAIRRTNFVATRYSKLCKLHFRDTDYLGELVDGKPRQRRYLRRHTVPSIFPWTKWDSTPLSRDQMYLKDLQQKFDYSKNFSASNFSNYMSNRDLVSPEIENERREYIIHEKLDGVPLIKLPDTTTVHVLKELRDIATQTNWNDDGF